MGFNFLKFAIPFIGEDGEEWYQCDESSRKYSLCRDSFKMNETEKYYITSNPEDILPDGSQKKYCLRHGFSCFNCEKEFGWQDARDVDREDNKYCENCYNSIKKECINCKLYFVPNDLTETRHGKNICYKCLVTCDICKDTISPYETTEVNSETGSVYLCEDCLNENTFYCDFCNSYYTNDTPRRVEEQDNGDSKIYCANCGSARCDSCGKFISVEDYDTEVTELYGDIYCRDCYEKRLNAPEKFHNTPTFKINKYTNDLDQLRKLIPISSKDLKKQYPELFSNLTRLIKFSGGKTLTKEIVDQYESLFDNFEVQYSGWNSSLQTTRLKRVRQLVLNIIYPGQVSEEAEKFWQQVNAYYKNEGHPSANKQVGWVRMDLNDEEKYILIEEIQSDLDKALFIKQKQFKSNPAWNELKEIVKIFPDLAMQAVFKFAKQNGYETLYYHTYENKIKLHGAHPPRSIYTNLPGQYGFKPTNDMPFGVSGNYLSRHAKFKIWKKLFKSGMLRMDKNAFL